MDKNGQNRGRPTAYRKEFTALVYDYAENPKKYDDPVPTIEGACCEIGISKQTAYSWGEKHPEFLDALEALKHEQARLLQKYGLLNKTNAVITKLMLSANHGMAERSEQKQEQSGNVTVTIKKL